MIRPLCSLLIVLTTSGALAQRQDAPAPDPAASDVASYVVLMRLLQVDALPTDDKSPPDLSVTRAAASMPVLADVSIIEGGDSDQYTRTGNSKVPLSFAHPKAHVVIGGTIDIDLEDPTADPRVTHLSAPRLVVVRDQEAVVTIGAPVSHLEADASGCLREVEGDAFEGMTLRVTATPEGATTDRIRVDRLVLELNEVAAREPVADCSLDVGRPIMRNTRLETSFSMPDGVTAVAPIYMMGQRAEGIVVLLSIRRVDPDTVR